MTQDVVVDYMAPEEMELLKGLVGRHKIVSEFVYIWTRWKNWEKSPPIVVLVDGELVGFHAVSYTKSGYVNSLYLWIDDDYRDMRLAGETVEFILEEAPDKGIKRLKMRCGKKDGGDAFWRGFGLLPIGETEEEFFYDLSIEGVASIEKLILDAKELCATVTEDKRTITHYRKLDVEITHPAWEGVL